MKKHFTYFVLLAFCILWYPHFSKGQAHIYWQTTLGGNGADVLTTFKITPDNRYILGGYSTSPASCSKSQSNCGNSDIWIALLDSNGTLLKERTLGGLNYDRIEALDILPNNHFLLGGFSRSDSSCNKNANSKGNDDYWILEIDTALDIVNQATLGGNNQDWLWYCKRASDGGILIGGWSLSGASGDKTDASRGDRDFWVLKLDANLNKIWDHTFGGSSTDELRGLCETPSGDIILAGLSNSNASFEKSENSRGGHDYWVLKLDSAGTLLWDKTFGGSSTEFCESVTCDSLGNIIISGSSQSGISGDKTENSNGGFDWWIVKLDASGNEIWQNTIGGSNDDLLFYTIVNQEGDYFLGGTSRSGVSGDKLTPNCGDEDYWVMLVDDSTGIPFWQATIAGDNYDRLLWVEQNLDGGYVLGGHSNSGNSCEKNAGSCGDVDYWMVKLLPDSLPNNSEFHEATILNMFPNPADAYISVQLPAGAGSEFQVQVYNPAGALVLFQESRERHDATIRLDVSLLDAGLYFLTLQSPAQIIQAKFIVMHQ